MKKTQDRVLIGKLSELPERLGKTFIIGDEEFALFKLACGDVRAIENRCPHKGGVLTEGMVSGEYVFCPMHDWKINVCNGQVQAPDHGCVRTYKVEVEEDLLYIFI